MHKKRLTGAPAAAHGGGMPGPNVTEGLARSSGRWGRCVGLSLLLAAAATTMTACSSGNGGSNGVPPSPQASGSVFAYPYNGQQDVVLNSQIVTKFEHGLSVNASSALALRAGSPTASNTPAQISADSNSSSDQAGIVTITPSTDLKPNTTYYIVATQDLADTTYSKGDTITQFTTGPAPGRPAASDQLTVVQTAPGDVNPVTHAKSVFTQFNSVHVVFSEPVDPSSVVAGDTFKFTNASGNEIPGRLTVIGHELTFDPTDDLAPGKYTLSLSDGVTSEFGKSLKAYSETKTVLDAGKLAVENTTVTPSSNDVDALPDNILDGGPINLVRISNQLIGLNNQPAMNSPARQGVQTVLAQPGMKGFGDVLPATIRAGQKFQLTPLTLRLDGSVPTPIKSGPIQVQFANDANVYLMANDLSNVTKPTAVRLRFDLAISTLIEASTDQATTLIQSLADGVFNQSVLNIQAAGLAIPQQNGDLKIDTLGTFPILVNRTDRATVDFELSLTLPGGDQTPVQKDTTPPYLVAQSPSACLYTFGTPAYDAAYAQYGAAPTALPEQACLQVLNQGGALDTASGINNFPIEASPAVVFSEPVDPNTVNDNSIQLTSGTGNAQATYQVDGSSVVINPDQPLQPNTQYTITLGSGAAIKDTAGNALTNNPTGIGPGQTISFTTEPLVDTHPTPPILGELTPGVPCALSGGDFASGGDTAGQCVGDAGNNTTNPLSVFTSPANVPVNASFSKFVTKSSIKLADGCLTGGSGKANTVNGATVALEQVDGSGQCVGTPAAAIGFANRDGDTTRGFSIAPVNNLESGSRYEIVICGTENSVCSASIVDTDGEALNTDPLSGSGSTNANSAANVAGGPDIIMPFDVTDASTDYYADQFTLPATDSNGNGQFDDANGDGAYTSGDADERPQPGNRALVELTLAGSQIKNANRDDGLYPAYLSLTRPIAIRQTSQDCSAIDSITDDNGNSVAGSTPDQCIQVSLLPGGFSALTGIGIGLTEALPAVTGSVLTPLQNAANAGTPLGDIPVIGPVLNGTFDTVSAALTGVTQAVTGALNDLVPVNGDPINTGRVILRFPDLSGNSGGDQGTQSGYIVPECTGSINGTGYDYSPCFVASLQLVANAPDGQGVTLAQQDLTVNVVGPVTFEQNGRLVISLRNANTFALSATALNLLPAKATIAPGNLHYQLVGNAVHGGRAYPQR
ncbi:Ig-like domain-containing protein [Salinisphaera hydrothermalis]|uniref:Ig-like domain-containing protein n=1 Tax=Salinisphaera hydrothermalis TaxID=563188 RepID=UPI003340AE4E